MPREYTRNERLASTIYPAHADPELRKEMALRAMHERRKSSEANLLPDRTRQHVSPLGGVAKSK
jgi:hypothetical protein